LYTRTVFRFVEPNGGGIFPESMKPVKLPKCVPSASDFLSREKMDSTKW